MAKNELKSVNRSDTTSPKKSKQKTEDYKKYQSYIRSKYWKDEVRPKVLDRDNHRCVCCGRTSEEANLTIHHSTYDILYKELEGDNMSKLVTLCQYCHKGIHSVRSNFQRFNMKPDNRTTTEVLEDKLEVSR